MHNSLCFPKAKRLLRPSDFSRVYKQAKRLNDDSLTIVTQPNSFGMARIGFGFSKKKVKSAVSRNTLKRVGRESFRLAHKNLPAVDIVVVARLPITRVDKQALRGAFDRLWQRLPKLYGGS